MTSLWVVLILAFPSLPLLFVLFKHFGWMMVWPCAKIKLSSPKWFRIWYQSLRSHWEMLKFMQVCILPEIFPLTNSTLTSSGSLRHLLSNMVPRTETLFLIPVIPTYLTVIPRIVIGHFYTSFFIPRNCGFFALLGHSLATRHRKGIFCGCTVCKEFSQN